MRKFFSSPLRLALTCIFGFIITHILLLMARMHGPPLISRLAGFLQGVGTTPFFMEFTVFIFGFLCILTVNHFRRKWGEEELVSMEVSDSIRTTETDRMEQEILAQEESSQA